MIRATLLLIFSFLFSSQVALASICSSMMTPQEVEMENCHSEKSEQKEERPCPQCSTEACFQTALLPNTISFSPQKLEKLQFQNFVVIANRPRASAHHWRASPQKGYFYLVNWQAQFSVFII